MTKDQIALRAHNYNTRIDSLQAAIHSLTNFGCGVAEGDIMNLKIMLAEYDDKLENLFIDKEYVVSFEGGGWNTTSATNDEDALKFAKAKYDGEHTKVYSVSIASPDGIEAAMRSFY